MSQTVSHCALSKKELCYQCVKCFPPADVEDEDDAVRVSVELVPDLGEEGRSGGVEDVDGDLALVHEDPCRPVVDADGRQVPRDEPLLAITLFVLEQILNKMYKIFPLHDKP